MSRKIFNIIMDAPLGERNGTLEINALTGKVTGSLTILGKCNPLSGVIDTEGRCFFTGTIITLIKAHPYFADGVITEDYVKLALSTGRAVYEVNGSPRKVNTNG